MCRGWEEGFFREDPVLSQLQSRFVEARLHTDGSTNIDRIKELQNELAGIPANPVYVLIDPTTEEVRGKVEGAKKAAFLELIGL